MLLQILIQSRHFHLTAALKVFQNHKSIKKEQIHPKRMNKDLVTSLAHLILHHLPTRQNSSSTAVGLGRPPHTTRTVVRTQCLEAVPQGLHVGVFVALELETGGNDLGGPGDARSIVVGLEHQVEVAGVGRVDGEVVRAVPGVGFGVGGEPCLCELVVSICLVDVMVYAE
jgi:hypothetical protein